jgi:hypothetical protein
MSLKVVMKKMGSRVPWVLSVLAPVMMAGSGCRSVPVHQQRLVAKAGMTFSDSPVFRDTTAVLNQIETGAAGSGGAAAAGCTSCR